MLLIDIPAIPPEGIDIEEPLDPASVHVEGEASFALEPGGRLAVHVERVDGTTVHVRGEMTAPLGLECARCLETFKWTVDQGLDLFFLPHEPGRTDEEEDEVELSDRDMVVAYYEGDRLDLGDMVREQLFLGLPMRTLCRDDCRGRCPSCGANLNRERCACPPPAPETDPRLLPLKKILDDTH
jgi:DUF177 domain-containing protein